MFIWWPMLSIHWHFAVGSQFVGNASSFRFHVDWTIFCIRARARLPQAKIFSLATYSAMKINAMYYNNEFGYPFVLYGFYAARYLNISQEPTKSTMANTDTFYSRTWSHSVQSKRGPVSTANTHVPRKYIAEWRIENKSKVGSYTLQWWILRFDIYTRTHKCISGVWVGYNVWL